MKQLPRRATIERPVSIEGIGLHTGVPARLTFKPAPSGAGRFFRRVDLPGQPVIPAGIDQVREVLRGTTLGNGEVGVNTVEHVLAAAYGLQLDDLEMELSGAEPPAADGSALPFAEILKTAGRKEYDEPAEFCHLDEMLQWQEGDKSMSYLPADGFEVTFTLDYSAHGQKLRQVRHVKVESQAFFEQIAFARTFGFVHEFEMLKSKNLALGGSLDNAVVVQRDGTIVNTGGLREEFEFVRHKILDLIGDLALIGRRLRGHIVAHKTGHAANVKFARRLCERSRALSERKPGTMMNIEAIKEVLPHRYPFLLVDRILSVEPGKKVIGVKNVTANEEFFNGHFPQRPVMPGVLLVEAMAQVAGVMFLLLPEHKGKIPFFCGIDGVRFRRPVVPGDRVEMTVETLKVRGNTGKVSCVARVDGDEVAGGELMFQIV